MIKKILTFFAIVYILGCTAVYLTQNEFIFLADKLPETYQFHTGEEVEIPIDNGIEMNALWIKNTPDQRSEKVIFYLHGNKGNIKRCTYQVRMMQDLGYDIFLPDYRSYGKTEGKIKNQAQLLTDVQRAYDFLKARYGEENIQLVGYSLGTGMASYLASKNKPENLFLVAPFTSLTDIKNQYLWFMPDFLLKFPLPVKDFLEDVSCPVHIIHGTADEVVKYDFSKKIKSMFPQKVNLYTAEQVSHRRIIFDPLLRNVLEKVLI